MPKLSRTELIKKIRKDRSEPDVHLMYTKSLAQLRKKELQVISDMLDLTKLVKQDNLEDLEITGGILDMEPEKKKKEKKEKKKKEKKTELVEDEEAVKIEFKEKICKLLDAYGIELEECLDTTDREYTDEELEEIVEEHNLIRAGVEEHINSILDVLPEGLDLSDAFYNEVNKYLEERKELVKSIIS